MNRRPRDEPGTERFSAALALIKETTRHPPDEINFERN
jgi:hypothetical protein